MEQAFLRRKLYSLSAPEPSKTPTARSSTRVRTAATLTLVAVASFSAGLLLPKVVNPDQDRLDKTIEDLDDVKVTEDGQILGTTTLDTDGAIGNGFQTKVILNSDNELEEVHMTVSVHEPSTELTMPTVLFDGPASVIASHERPDGTFITVAQSPELEGQIGNLLDITVAGFTQEGLQFAEDSSVWPEVGPIKISSVVHPSTRDAGRIVGPPELGPGLF